MIAAEEETMAHVLVVEDDAQVRGILAALLQEAGHEARAVNDGLEAMDALLLVPQPMVVLLDLLMPRMGGGAILRLVAEGHASLAPHTYILVTALAGTLPNDLPPLLKQLEVPLIAKPFDADILLNTVEAAAARLRARSDT
jgi:CheY-like chemotaxis protein